MKKLKIFEEDESKKDDKFIPTYSVLSTQYEKILDGCIALIPGINVGIKDGSQTRQKVNYSAKGLSISLRNDYNSRSDYAIACSVTCKKNESLNFGISLSTYSEVYLGKDGYMRSKKDGYDKITNRSDLQKCSSDFLSHLEKIMSELDIKEGELSGNGNDAASYSDYRIMANQVFKKYNFPSWLGRIKEESGDNNLSDLKITGKNDETSQQLTIFCSIGKDSSRCYFSKGTFSLKYKDFETKEDFEKEFKSKFEELVESAIIKK